MDEAEEPELAAVVRCNVETAFAESMGKLHEDRPRAEAGDVRG
jgi:hypothetical protein